MTWYEQVITVLLAVGATVLTRFLPFAVFSEQRKTPDFIQYLGKALPSAVFALLVVYCFRNIADLSSSYIYAQIIASGVVVVLHLIWRNMFVSMMLGTVVYMLLVQLVFV
ncbi:MAG: AzlD domain-containing protein [Actinomycetaceae bacterium]|nr:AzlD domain-containing protein [Actinomycetaceae bacterium]